MSKIIIIFVAILTSSIFLINCGSNSSSNEKTDIIKEYKDSIALDEKAEQDSIVNSDFKDEKIKIIPKNEPNLNFEQLYPILKKSLLEVVCESYRIEEGNNGLSVYSNETDDYLSSWGWDLSTLLIKDIDKDGLIDYTLELSNEGGGCGGQIAELERWTLFGSKPDRFKWTHTIPYRSESGKWEKNN